MYLLCGFECFVNTLKSFNNIQTFQRLPIQMLKTPNLPKVLKTTNQLNKEHQIKFLQKTCGDPVFYKQILMQQKIEELLVDPDLVSRNKNISKIELNALISNAHWQNDVALERKKKKIFKTEREVHHLQVPKAKISHTNDHYKLSYQSTQRAEKFPVKTPPRARRHQKKVSWKKFLLSEVVIFKPHFAPETSVKMLQFPQTKAEALDEALLNHRIQCAEDLKKKINKKAIEERLEAKDKRVRRINLKYACQARNK